MNLQWFAIILALLASILLVDEYGPEPVAQQLFREAADVESDQLAKDIVGALQDGARTFSTGTVTSADSAILHTIAEISGIYKLILRDATGRAFWSNRTEDMGVVAKDEATLGVLKGKGHFFAHEHQSTESVIGGTGTYLNAFEGDNGEHRDVNHVIVAASQDGVVLGAIESFADVSETNDRFIRTIRFVFVVLGGVVGSLGVALILRLRTVARKSLETSVAHADAQSSFIAQQGRMGREVRLLGELNEWLQSSKSLDELFYMVTRFMTHLLPKASGSIYVYSNSRDVLDGAITWNGGVKKQHIHPEDCWGLRRGRTYSYAEGEVQFKCGHAHDEEAENYICIPFLAHGETVGMMHLVAHRGVDNEAFTVQRKLAQLCAEQISLAIANVRMRDELHHQAIRDVLTGLYNRRHLMDTLRRRIETRKSEKFSIISIDVDYFKKFNDNHGHDAGDTVLRTVGETMIASCDGSEVAARMGGEELMILLPDTSLAEAIERAEALRVAVSELTVRYGDKDLPQITISIGVAEYPTHGTTPQDVVREADVALYEAKDAGRNCVVKAGVKDSTVDDPNRATKLVLHAPTLPALDGDVDDHLTTAAE
jgi:diguanylate cyclase (GGDEF)-like protein